MGPHQATNMAEEGDFSIDTGDAGAAEVHSMEAGQIRKGGYIMIKGSACKVRDVSTSKTGKHGHAKCKFLAACIFTGATKEELCPATHGIDVPFVKKDDYMVNGIEDGGYLQLMHEDDGVCREDLQLPNVEYKTDDDEKFSALLVDYINQMNEGANIEIYCTVQRAIGKEKIIDVRKKDAA